MRRLLSGFDFEERVVLAIASVLSVMFALLAVAGYGTRHHSDHEVIGYAAGWTAFWLAMTTIVFVIAAAMIHTYREKKR